MAPACRRNAITAAEMRLPDLEAGATLKLKKMLAAEGWKMNATRISAFSMVLAVSLLAYSGSGNALVGNSFFEDDVLTTEDLAMQKEAGRKLLESGKEGDVAEWSNAASKSFGSIKLGESLTYKGNECRRVEVVNVPRGNEVERYWLKHTVCNIPGKGWRYLN
ncbi:hypothetical protein NUH88_17800 [Nisaea acidiphila]|uniref:Surface antigen domain-containing protein n=1 Tax=Nisaea acidiphila TaxID=1862145 RepID=A0A9J7ANN3_9PROT|nr:hypothetical protein [Nisaea acidiphila]UUX49243.1 hypothetical protein NUH88_17800 [Nisaea acidiphila]